MSARRDRAVTHSCLTALSDVLAEGRWPADGRDLLETALEFTERRTLGERARALRGAETVLIGIGAVSAALATSAWTGWFPWVWPTFVLGIVGTTWSLTQAGMTIEAKARTRTVGRHR